jgi:protein gp37
MPERLAELTRLAPFSDLRGWRRNAAIRRRRDKGWPEADLETRWKIFVCSMSDFYHESVDDVTRSAVMSVIGKCPHLAFIVLTKRPHRIPAGAPWFPNVWLGVTVENQKRADERVPLLMQIPAAVRFVSVEPMLEPVDLSCWLGTSKINWVIVGPETGPRRRQFDAAWVDGRHGLDVQCMTCGAAFFDKRDQWTRREFPERRRSDAGGQEGGR